MIVYNLVHDLQLYSIDHIGKIISKVLKIEFETLMTLFALTGEGVAAILNRVCIVLNKFLIISQLYIIKIIKEL